MEVEAESSLLYIRKKRSRRREAVAKDRRKQDSWVPSLKPTRKLAFYQCKKMGDSYIGSSFSIILDHFFRPQGTGYSLKPKPKMTDH